MSNAIIQNYIESVCLNIKNMHGACGKNNIPHTNYQVYRQMRPSLTEEQVRYYWQRPAKEGEKKAKTRCTAENVINSINPNK